MIKYILFDLDGTLLPMDQEVFVKDYFGRLARHVAPIGYAPQTLFKNLWQGVGAMVMNDGNVKNEVVFWKTFEKLYGNKVYDDIPVFDEFYRTDFQNTAKVCGHNPKAKACVDRVKEMGGPGYESNLPCSGNRKPYALGRTCSGRFRILYNL